MKTSHHNAADSLYVQLAKRAPVDSDEVDDGVVLDFDTNGALVGIDVQHVSLREGIQSQSVLQRPSGRIAGCVRTDFCLNGRLR